MSGVRATKWVEELVHEWISKVEDETQLEQWERIIADRLTHLKKLRWLSIEEIKAGLRSCKRGTRLYADQPIGDSGDTECFFMQWQPRAQRVWLADGADAAPRKWRHINLREAHHVQLARTELNTRKRAPKEAA